MTIIELADVTFASSIRIGKENYEKNFIDPTNRVEDRNYRLFYVPEQNIIYIISLDPYLSDEKMRHKRVKACGMDNIRSMTPLVVPAEIKTIINKSKASEKKAK